MGIHWIPSRGVAAAHTLWTTAGWRCWHVYERNWEMITINAVAGKPTHNKTQHLRNMYLWMLAVGHHAVETQPLQQKHAQLNTSISIWNQASLIYFFLRFRNENCSSCADKGHGIWAKAPEQLLKGPQDELVLFTQCCVTTAQDAVTKLYMWCSWDRNEGRVRTWVWSEQGRRK